jgi:hypothetical protein
LWVISTVGFVWLLLGLTGIVSTILFDSNSVVQD